ncbi:MAG: serine hydrolase [Gemmatimonadaceae bacterium]|nr:serine hydrolase [Gemmatimonadaceae bacterium]
MPDAALEWTVSSASGRWERGEGTGGEALRLAGPARLRLTSEGVAIDAAHGASLRIRFDELEGDALMNALALFNPSGYSSFGVVNTPAWRSALVPSTNGHGTANGLARIYAALAERGRLLSTELLDHATHTCARGQCAILGEQIEVGLGFTPTTARRPLGPNPDSFGHFGTGGALGFADPAAQLGFGYVMNHVIPRWQSPRNRALIDAVYASL